MNANKWAALLLFGAIVITAVFLCTAAGVFANPPTSEQGDPLSEEAREERLQSKVERIASELFGVVDEDLANVWFMVRSDAIWADRSSLLDPPWEALRKSKADVERFGHGSDLLVTNVIRQVFDSAAKGSKMAWEATLSSPGLLRAKDK